MIVAVDLTSLSYHMTGIERYAACVTEEMLKQDAENEYILVFRDEVYHVFKHYIDNKKIRALILNGNCKAFFYQWTLYRSLSKIKADRFLFFAFTSPVLFRRRGIYNTIHDMGAWDSAESMKLLQKIYWRTTYSVAAKTSDFIITVSEFSKNRIADILHFPKDRIKVIHSAVYNNVVDLSNAEYKDVKKRYALPSRYIMSLSTLEPRKNLHILIDAFVHIMDKVPYDLVLVGRKGWKIDEMLEKYNAQSRIHITGFVEDEHVAHIYKNALCFVFPSIYEGFGLPPVEALSVGTPVIASDAASIPEVMRKQAVYFKNNSKEELEDILLNLESNIDAMPIELDEYQKNNYRFDVSAKKVLTLINSLEG